MTTNGDSHSTPGNSPADNLSDWQKTINETPASGSKLPFEDTTSPGTLNSSGLPLHDALIGRPLGSGVIVEHIGSGGMGDVYKIWNERIEKYRAVKLLKHGSNQQLEKRFEREIKITAAFEHPNIVHVIDAARWKGYLYLEMEYVQGMALDALLQKHGNLPAAVCISIGILVSRALKYAHNHTYTLDGQPFTGVIHRDLKPSNIMLADDGRLKLMDFGIARPVGGELATLTMGVVGSWVYLPPEQLDGCSVDFRADIYTLGEVLYELLSGKPPFVFENQRDFLNIKTRGKYESLLTSDGKIPDLLIKIIDKCLKVNADGRFQSAADLENELSNLLKKLFGQPPEQIITSFVKGEAIADNNPNTPAKKRIFNPLAIAIVALIALQSGIFFYILRPDGHRKSDNRKTASVTAPHIIKPSDKALIRTDSLAVTWHTTPGIPILKAPLDNSSDSRLPVSFGWEPVPEAQSYHLQIASDTSFEKIAFENVICKETALTVSSLRLPAGYYWRVHTNSGSTSGKWSAIFKCTFKDTVPAKPEFDYGADAATAMRKGDLTAAETALANMLRNDSRIDTIRIRLAGMLLNAGNSQKAEFHLNGVSISDMLCDVLRARLLIEGQDFTEAQAMLTGAAHKKTRFNKKQILADVCYFKAKAAQGIFKRQKSNSTRMAALTAWEEVWKLYKENPTHSRFREAAQQSSRIAEE